MLQVPAYTISQPTPGSVRIDLKGDWTLASAAPAPDQALRMIAAATAGVTVNGAALGVWDTRLLLFLRELAAAADKRSLRLQNEAGDVQGASRSLQGGVEAGLQSGEKIRRIFSCSHAELRK